MCAVLILQAVTDHFRQWAKEEKLLIESYSPLGSNDQVKETLNVPEVKKISQALGITPAQVVISWHVQRGVSGETGA